MHTRSHSHKHTKWKTNCITWYSDVICGPGPWVRTNELCWVVTRSAIQQTVQSVSAPGWTSSHNNVTVANQRDSGDLVSSSPFNPVLQHTGVSIRLNSTRLVFVCACQWSISVCVCVWLPMHMSTFSLEGHLEHNCSLVSYCCPSAELTGRVGVVTAMCRLLGRQCFCVWCVNWDPRPSVSSCATADGIPLGFSACSLLNPLSHAFMHHYIIHVYGFCSSVC